MAYRRSALVTGGAGFIGSHLVDRLVQENYRVIIVDDLSTGKLKNLNHDATFHHMSITQPTFPDVLNRERPDLVFHLAAQSSVPHSVKDPILDNEVNVLGTLRLLEASRRAGVEKIIYSSTGGALYGEPEVVPCPDDAPVTPISPYGMSKYMAEQYLDFYSRQYRVEFHDAALRKRVRTAAGPLWRGRRSRDIHFRDAGGQATTYLRGRKPDAGFRVRRRHRRRQHRRHSSGPSKSAEHRDGPVDQRQPTD